MSMNTNIDMDSLSLRDIPGLDNISLDILLIILTHLNTAQSIAALGLTCKKLHRAVRFNGWRIFVRKCFGSLALPEKIADNQWPSLARKLTWQSRAWDRRALVVDSWIPPSKQQQQTRNPRGGQARASQTAACHIIVDAARTRRGKLPEETVVWGAGEDLVARTRLTGRHAKPKTDKWRTLPGEASGFRSGVDDITAVSILSSVSAPQPTGMDGALVGRASGDLRLLSLDLKSFGHTKLQFMPSFDADTGYQFPQRTIQSLDLDKSRSAMVASTNDSVLLYSLNVTLPSVDENAVTSADLGFLDPYLAINLKTAAGARPFQSLRTVKYMDDGDLAVGTTSSSQPLRYLTTTPSGVEFIAAAKMLPSARCPESYFYPEWQNQSVRDVLPVNMASVAGGKGNVILASYDDGIIRLQDLRTPSAVDTMYQDNFEVTTPSGPLLAWGTDRFLAGSARSTNLKIFDFRWARPYYYADALPCSSSTPSPTPRPPTVLSPPQLPTSRPRCDHIIGQRCARHILSRTDFYRPNCNIYLPVRSPQSSSSSSPIYSLAKSSDLSTTIYAGMTAELAEINLREADDYNHPAAKPPRRRVDVTRNNNNSSAGYAQTRGCISLIETGDGFALDDIGKSQRVPPIMVQEPEAVRPNLDATQYRLDDLFVPSVRAVPV